MTATPGSPRRDLLGEAAPRRLCAVADIPDGGSKGFEPLGDGLGELYVEARRIGLKLRIRAATTPLELDAIKL